MHRSSLINMQKFKDRYLKDRVNLKVLDVGSQDICGSYREMFRDQQYVGFDIVEGKNVNITDWNEIEDQSYDVVISGQAFEHIEHDFEVMKEISRVMKPGAQCCIIAPSQGPKHCLPDYRRYQTDDLKTLAQQAGLTVLQVRIDETKPWNDCVLIATKDL